jgi:hypothetical protein
MAACSLLFVIAAIAADLPTELKLTNGATLHNASVVRWEKDRVILKHAGGIDPIRYDHIDEAQRAAVFAAKAQLTATEQNNDVIKPSERKISGTAYDQGIEQPYVFAAMKVYVYPVAQMDAVSEADRESKELPPALLETTTDKEGRFDLSVSPESEVFIFAKYVRSYRIGTRSVWVWTLPLSKIPIQGRCDLTKGNAQVFALVEGLFYDTEGKRVFTRR